MICQLIAGIFFIAVSIAAATATRIRSANEITQFIKRMVQTGDLRQTAYTLSELSKDALEGVSYFDRKGIQVFSWPDGIDSQKFYEEPSVLSLTPVRKYKTNFHLGETQSEELGSIVFLYNAFTYLNLAFFALLVFSVSSAPLFYLQAQKNHFNRFKKEREAEREQFLFIAKKAAHNLRAPLSALKMIVAKSDLPAEQSDLLHESIFRLTVIADGLLKDSGNAGAERQNVDGSTPHWGKVSGLLKECVDDFSQSTSSDITVTYNPEKLKTEPEANFDAAELRTILENLLANAVEAIKSEGAVCVSSRFYRDSLMIVVQDDGCGVPAQLLPMLFREGATFGKAKGNGLGLYTAKKTIESWGGSIRLQSVEGQGTLLSILLKIREASPSVGEGS